MANLPSSQVLSSPPSNHPDPISKISFADAVASKPRSFPTRVQSSVGDIFAPLQFGVVAAGNVPVQRFNPIDLPSRRYARKDGKPSISFTAEEIKAGSKRFEFSLIAKFTFGRPPLREIRQFLDANWSVQGRMSVSDIWDGRHLVIILDSETDVRTALTSPCRKVGHSFFRLFRWSSDYDYKRESTKRSTWVRLPGLPMQLYDKGFIKSIISSFAFFLDTDARTKALTNLNFARACVEIDMKDDLITEVWIQNPDESGFWQPIEYEGNTQYCSLCKLHGHENVSCRKRNKMQNQGVSSNQSKEFSQINCAPQGLQGQLTQHTGTGPHQHRGTGPQHLGTGQTDSNPSLNVDNQWHVVPRRKSKKTKGDKMGMRNSVTQLNNKVDSHGHGPLGSKHHSEDPSHIHGNGSTDLTTHVTSIKCNSTFDNSKAASAVVPLAGRTVPTDGCTVPTDGHRDNAPTSQVTCSHGTFEPPNATTGVSLKAGCSLNAAVGLHVIAKDSHGDGSFGALNDVAPTRGDASADGSLGSLNAAVDVSRDGTLAVAPTTHLSIGNGTLGVTPTTHLSIRNGTLAVAPTTQAHGTSDIGTHVTSKDSHAETLGSSHGTSVAAHAGVGTIGACDFRSELSPIMQGSSRHGTSDQHNATATESPSHNRKGSLASPVGQVAPCDSIELLRKKLGRNKSVVVEEDVEPNEAIALEPKVAQKIAKYGGHIFAYDQGSPINARDYYLGIKAHYGEKDSQIFRVMDIIYNEAMQARNEGSPAEESDGSIDLSRIIKNPRQKPKGSRRSGRSCSKKCDSNLVY